MSTKKHAATTPTLSRDRIVEAAIGIAERDGLVAVSLRKVAGKLGVTPMALYWHVENKEALLGAMVDWLYDQMDFTINIEASWQRQLRAIIEAEIDVLRSYPRTAMLILSRGSTAPNTLIEAETVLGILDRAGFPPEDAAKILTYLETLVSLVAREALLAPASDDGEPAAWQRQVRETIESLPADQYPHIIAAADHLSSRADPDSYYRFGIDLLIAGIEALAEQRARD